MRIRLVLHGKICGEGHEAACTIDAVRPCLLGGTPVAETAEWSIRDISQPLPDGNYEVFAESERVPVRILNGECLLVGRAKNTVLSL